VSSAPKRHVVIVGAGLAGHTVAARLAQQACAASITLVGDEGDAPYDRPPLSKQYQVDGNESAVLLAPELPGEVVQLRRRKAVAIDTVARQLHLDDGSALPWNQLVLATGARPRVLPHLSASARVRTLRTLDDARAIRGALKPGSSLLVIGAGPIGLELAATAAGLGVQSTVVEMAARVMSRSVPAAMAELVLAHHRSKGLAVHLGRTVSALDEARGEAILDDGGRVPAALVVVGIGVLANDQLAAQAGIACDDGIVVDAFGRTTAPDVFAVGDVSRQRHPISGRLERIETWSNAQGQAQALAAHLCNPGESKPFGLVPWFWSDQGDLRLQCAGGMSGDLDAWREDPAGGRILVQWTGGRVTGVAALNAARDFVQLKRLIVERPTITAEELAAPDANIRALVQRALAN
jgi:3-phenylpropionate/trans-cinnamate dioxygenase ferredoxin reductase subunit